MANKTIRFLGTPVDIAPGTTGSWQTVDLDSFITVDDDDTGVLLHFVVLSTATTRLYGARTGGSSDGSFIGFNEDHQFMAMGIDGSNVVEIWVGDADIEVWAFGMTGTAWEFLTDVRSFSPSVTSTWETNSIAGYFSTDDNVAVCGMLNGSSSRRWGIRHPSDTDGWLEDGDDAQRWAGVLTDTSLAVFRTSTNITGYIQARLDGSADIVVNTSQTDITPSSGGSPETKLINSSAIAVMGHSKQQGGTRGVTIGPDGLVSGTHYDPVGRGAASNDMDELQGFIVECDGAGEVEIEHAETADLTKWFAYFTVPAAAFPYRKPGLGPLLRM